MNCDADSETSRLESLIYRRAQKRFLDEMRATTEGQLLDLALQTAQRSDLKLFRTGAVIIDRSGRIVGRGCSYKTATASVHAEQNALQRTREGHEIFIATLTQGGNFGSCSRPCASCARRLYRAGIEIAHWYERCNDGSWELRSEYVEDLYNAAQRVKPTRYANRMLIEV